MLTRRDIREKIRDLYIIEAIDINVFRRYMQMARCEDNEITDLINKIIKDEEKKYFEKHKRRVPRRRTALLLSPDDKLYR